MNHTVRVARRIAEADRAGAEGSPDFVSQREHDLLDDKLERYFSLLTGELQKAETNRKETLNAAALSIQTGLDKAERTLQMALDKAERNLQIALEAAEKRVNEKFGVQKEAAESAAIVLKEKLHDMNAFRQQISAERALYVTRDQLSLTHEGIDLRMKGIEGLAANYQGRMWAVGAVISVIVSLLTIALHLIWPRGL